MDGLRALACSLVFAVHWQQTTGVGRTFGPFDFKRLLLNGNTGVALFMVLSGYLLSLPLYSMPIEQRLRRPLPHYWRNRACRILPAYWLCLLLLALASANFRSPAHLLDVLLHATFLHNFRPETIYSISSPFWAIAVFAQFYVVFYLVVVALRVVGTIADRAIVIAFFLVAVGGQGIATAMFYLPSDMMLDVPDGWSGANTICLEHSLVIHLPIFWFGIVAGAIHRRLPKDHNFIADVGILTSVILMVIILGTDLDEHLQIEGTRYNFPIIPSLLAAALVATPRSRLALAIVEMRAVRWLGVVSYAFYLFHLPAMEAMARIASEFQIPWQTHPLAFGITTSAATFVASHLSYQLVERPLQSRFRKSVA
ncbi:acyltransferase family protein [Roseiconus lacunae]|uniref:Acyltransferase n=1 Tax=Roseiconus lacunae TaxID=2605694 RepID=A0ABT7PPE1_9BACT|nr:acyltransferase [Roseiconus lacunae]MDM4018335.1 acyltransferase [Roseiconus lacunae]